MAFKPLHKRALLEIITSDDYVTPEAMVVALVETLDNLRSEDMQFVTVRQTNHADGAAYWGTGPYATFAQATKAIERSAAGPVGAGKVAIVPTFHPDRVKRSADKADVFPERHKGHWALYRERVGI